MQNFDLSALVRLCKETDPQQGHSQLLAGLDQLFPDLAFTPVLSRSGWYRLGGVVDAGAQRISDKLVDWVEAESGDDVMQLYHKYAEQGLCATRLNGITHYLVAQTGTRPQDFIQLEVEEVEERVHRPLFEPDAQADKLPDLIEELIDPLEYTHLDPVQVSPPRYLFRRIIPIADYLDSFPEEMDIEPPILRFMSDWAHSSAGETVPFCQHWVLAFREYTDGYGEPRFHAKPITTYSGEIETIGDDVSRGARLANLIHALDRQIGYPMAWYFFMLSHKQISFQIAESIHQDLMGAYDYLPGRDVKLIQQWYDRSYGV